jgi:membrane fusion protein (multidrug efflux system)
MTTLAAATMPTKKQIKKTLMIVGAVILVLAFIKYRQVSKAIAEHANFAPPPETVTSVTTTESTWPRTLYAVGGLSPEQGVTISAEEPGKVVRVGFESGSAVKVGDPLVELDTTVEEAKLKAAEAKAEWAQRSLGRAQRLRSTSAVSQEQVDDALSQSRQAEAEAQSLRALIAKKKITAPFAGRTGIRQVNVGQYLAAGTPIVPLHSLDPMHVDFTLPQQDVAELAVGQEARIKIDAFPDREFIGKLSAINPQVDPVTRNVAVQATVANPNEELRPGMFATITVVLPITDKVIAIPATSIQYAPYGDTVYVIDSMKDPAGKEFRGVRQQVVRVGRRQGEQIAILEGIKPGEEIVTSGVFKLHPGAAVNVNNAFAPGNSLEPKPADT